MTTFKKPGYRPPHWDEQVRLSYGLSCGCTQRKSKPVKAIEAANIPGHVIICDRCQEFAVIIRITTYLEYNAKVLARLLEGAEGMGIDTTTATAIAAEQVKS